jgi:hypothetical protein
MRTAWGATIIVTIITAFFFAYKGERRKTSKIEYLIRFFLVSVFVVIIAFFSIPKGAQILALDRIFPQITNYNPNATESMNMTFREALKKIANNPTPSFPYQERGNIWRQSLELSLKHPFVGLGIDYYDSSKPIIQGTDQVTMAHNIFFQIILTGGIGLLSIFLFVLWKIFSMLKNQTKDINWLRITAMICAIFIFSLFGDLFFGIPWLWIIAGLVIAQEGNAKIIMPEPEPNFPE